MKKITLPITILCLSLAILAGCNSTANAFDTSAIVDDVLATEKENLGSPPTIYDQYPSFIGFVEEITFDNINSGHSGYLHLRGNPSESGITPYARVRLEEGITRSEVSPRDLEIGDQVVVFSTQKGVAVWIALPFSASHTANDFILRLYADQRIYRTTDEVQIWATLEYVGGYDEITIFHSVPSIVFSITGISDVVD